MGWQIGCLVLLRWLGLRLYEPPVALDARGQSTQAIQVREAIAVYNRRSDPDTSTFSPPEEEGPGATSPTPPESLQSAIQLAARSISSPDWSRLTWLLCCVHALLSLGFTSFNVFLPAFLEQVSGQVHHQDSRTRPSSSDLRSTLLGWLGASLGGIIGSFVGAYLSGLPRLGRVGTMILSCSAASISIFCAAWGPWPVLASTVASLAAAATYAALYSYTAEVFPPTIRGVGGGIAMASSRAVGIVAPILAGSLSPKQGGLGVGPLYLAGSVLAVCAIAAYGLPYETLPQATTESTTPQNGDSAYSTLPQDPDDLPR